MYVHIGPSIHFNGGANNIYSSNYALQGGGMRMLSNSHVWLQNEIFSNNYGTNAGGGISGEKDYDTANNYSRIGGAIYMDCNLFIFDSTFSNN